MELIPSIAVIALLAIIIIVFCAPTDSLDKLLRDIKSRKKSNKAIDSPRRRVDQGGDRRSNQPAGTQIVAKLYLEQLDNDHSTVIKRFPIGEVPTQGLRISRDTASKGDIFLVTDRGQGNSVSECHATLYKDEDGYFLNDNGSTNGTFLMGNSTRQEQVDVKEGEILFLGTQAIRFRSNDIFAVQERSSSGTQIASRQQQSFSRRTPK